MEGAVARLEGRAIGLHQLAIGIVERFEGQLWVEPREGVPPPLQHDDAVVGALFARAAGTDVRAVRALPGKGREPRKRDVLDVGFGDGDHGPLRQHQAFPPGVRDMVTELPRRIDPEVDRLLDALQGGRLGAAVGAATGKLGHLRDERVVLVAPVDDDFVLVHPAFLTGGFSGLPDGPAVPGMASPGSHRAAG